MKTVVGLSKYLMLVITGYSLVLVMAVVMFHTFLLAYLNPPSYTVLVSVNGVGEAGWELWLGVVSLFFGVLGFIGLYKIGRGLMV